MPDRSSSQGLPDDWNRGSHARGQHSAAAASDAYTPGVTGPYRVRTADVYGTESTDAYGAGKTDAFGTRPASTYGVGSADPFRPANADPFGTRNADPFGAAAAGAYGAGGADGYGAGMTSGGATRTDAEPPTAAVPRSAPGEVTGSKGFLGALFDFGFTSFVTPKVIKVLYVLIMIGTVASALVFTIMAFKVSAVFGLVTLIVGDPLFILVVMAIYRIILEFFVVVFRVAEDVRALRERGDLR
jgi:Domain of unknown function (DUF4282)